MMKRLIGVLSVLLAASAVQAAVIVQDDFANWGATNAVPPTRPSSAPYGTLTQPAGNLQVTGGGADLTPREDFIYNSTALAGNKDYTLFGGAGGTNVMSVSFDFNAPGGAPSSLSLYFISNTNWVWYYDISPVSSGAGNYYANLTYADGWYNSQGRTAGQFLTDLTDVDEIGLLLSYQNNLGGQIYQVDNFQLLDAPIPEPATYAVLGFVGLSLCVTFRRQLRQSLVVVRQNFKA